MSVPEAASLDLPPLARFAIVLIGMMAVRWIGPRLHLPDCVGYILLGVVIGPHLLGVLPEHANVANFFAELGKLLLMFSSGWTSISTSSCWHDGARRCSASQPSLSL